MSLKQIENSESWHDGEDWLTSMIELLPMLENEKARCEEIGGVSGTAQWRKYCAQFVELHFLDVDEVDGEEENEGDEE